MRPLAIITRAVIISALGASASGCLAVAATGAVIGATGAVVGTGVKATGAVVGAVIPGGGEDEN